MEDKNDVGTRVKSAVNDAISAASSRAHDASRIAASSTQSLQDGVTQMTESTKHAMNGAAATVKETVAHSASSAKENLHDATDNARETTQTLAMGTKGFLEKNPLGLAIGAIAVGFLAGMTLPVSDLERDNVGPIGEKLSHQAKEAATDIVTQGKTVVVNAVTTALKTSPN